MADTPTVDVKDIVIEQLQTRIEALEKVNRAWQAYFDADLEPDPDPAVAAYTELHSALAALARSAGAGNAPCEHCGDIPCLGEFDP